MQPSTFLGWISITSWHNIVVQLRLSFFFIHYLDYHNCILQANTIIGSPSVIRLHFSQLS